MSIDYITYKNGEINSKKKCKLDDASLYVCCVVKCLFLHFLNGILTQKICIF